MTRHIGKGAGTGGDGLDVGRGPTQVAAGIRDRHRSPVIAGVGGGQSGAQCAGALIPGEGQRRSVIGQRHALLGNGAVHIVRHPGRELGAADGQGHGGGGGVADVLVGGNKLIQPEGATDSGASIDDIQAVEIGSALRQLCADILPACEVQGGKQDLAGLKLAVGDSGHEGVARAVAVHPHAQPALTGGDGQGSTQAGGAGRGVVGHLQALAAIVDVFQPRLHGGDSGVRGCEGVHAALQILQSVDMAGHTDRDGQGLPTGRDREGTAGALLPSGKHAVLVHGAHRRIRRPGKAGVLSGEIQAAVRGQSLQIYLLPGIQVQGSHRRAGGFIGQGDAVRGADGSDGDRTRGIAVVSGHLRGAALRPGGEQAIFVHRAAALGDLPLHLISAGRIVVGVQTGGGQLHRSAGEQQVIGGGHVVGVQFAGGLELGGQEDGGGVGPLAAVGGAVDHLHAAAVRVGDADGGGAAAVHADSLHTPQLNEALSHLGLGGPHAEARLLAVQGVEHQGAVGLDADGGPGSAGGIQAGGHLPVGHQLGDAAQGLVYLTPPGVGAGDGQGHRVTGHQGPQLVQSGRVVLGVEGKHRLALRNGDAAGGLQHLLHHVLGLSAHAGLGGVGAALILHRSEDHVHPRLAVLGRVSKVRGQQGQTAAAVTAGHLAHLVDAAAEVESSAAQSHRHGQPILGNEGGTVLIKADGPIAAVVAGSPHHAIGDDDAHRRAGGEDIPVPVKARDHPLALALQLLGHAGKGYPVGNLGAVGHSWGHISAGHILHIVLGTQIGVGVAPEIVGGQGGTYRDGCRSGM